MQRTRLVLAGLFVLALVIFVSRWLYRSFRFKSASAEAVYVVVAANDIGVGRKIEDKDIEILKLPGPDLPPGCLSRKSQVIGSGVVLPITNGDFIRRFQLTATNDFRLPGFYSKGDMRAVSVRVNNEIADLVVAGMHVDVRLDMRLTHRLNEQQTGTFLENVLVIETGQRRERNSAGDLRVVSVITLLAPPTEAEKLTLASSKNQVDVILPIKSTEFR